MAYDISIPGTRDDDNLAPAAGNEDKSHSISGGQGNDIITGGNQDDLLDGGQDDDVLNGGAGNDELDGGQGNDVLNSGSGDDKLNGGQGDDVLEGGSGNDILDAGPEYSGGSPEDRVYYKDAFVFNFQFSESKETTYYFRPNDDNTGGDTPSSQANRQAWDNYMERLKEWRAAMDAQNGKDTDQSATGEALYTVKKTTGSLGEFDNSYTVGSGPSITSSDGHDTIVNFWENSTLELKGLAGISFENFDKLFNVAYDETTDNTVLSWGDGSITIHGLKLPNDAEFYAAATQSHWFAV